MTAHAAALRLRTKDPVYVDRLSSNYRLVQLDARDRVMLDFAVKLTRAPDECTQSDLVPLRDAAYTDEDILHIAELTAIFNYNARVANATGLLPNVEYHDLGLSTSRLSGPTNEPHRFRRLAVDETPLWVAVVIRTPPTTSRLETRRERAAYFVPMPSPGTR